MKTLIINGGTIEDAFALSYIERVKPDCILAQTVAWNSVTAIR